MVRLFITALFTLTLLSMFNNCGSSRVENRNYTDSSQYLPDNCRVNTNYNLQFTPVPCSAFENGFITGRLSNYVDINTSSIRYDVIRLKLSQIPEQVLTGSSYLQFNGWRETCDLPQLFSPNASSFALQYVGNGSGGFYPSDASTSSLNVALQQANTGFTKLDQQTMELVADYFSVSVNDFHDEFFIVFTNVSEAQQAMQLGEYPNGGGASMNRVDFLLPPYWADPTMYRQTHIHSTITQLHPLNNNGAFFEYNLAYQQMMQYCSDMQN